MTGWLIDINPRECPPDVMDTPEAYRAAWGRYVGEAVPGDGDPEDWREQAARLEAATRILPDPHVRVAGRPYEGPDPMTLAHCVCSIESGPCERVDVFHVSGRFWSTSACGEKRTPARPAWTSFPS